MRAPTITRLNARYRASLALAELILRGCSVTTGQGKVRSVSFVFDMNRVFEDFLSTALRASLERHGGQIRLQYGKQSLAIDGHIRLVPDITWWRGGRCQAAVDAKYKRLTDSRFPNADAYQMLAYCTAFDLERGYLVYAKDATEHDRIRRVRNTAIDLVVRTVDVEMEPDMLMAQIEGLAAEIAFGRRLPAAPVAQSA